jgi:hypothetical protein
MVWRRRGIVLLFLLLIVVVEYFLLLLLLLLVVLAKSLDNDRDLKEEEADEKGLPVDLMTASGGGGCRVRVEAA